MVLHREIKYRLFTEGMKSFILLLAAGGNVLIRQVRQRQQQRSLFLVQSSDLCIAFLNSGYQFLHSCHNFRCIAAGLFDLRNLLAGSILLGLHRFDFTHLLTLLGINGQHFVHNAVKVHFSFLNSCLYFLGLFSEVFNVNHFYYSFSSAIYESG